MFGFTEESVTAKRKTGLKGKCIPAWKEQILFFARDTRKSFQKAIKENSLYLSVIKNKIKAVICQHYPDGSSFDTLLARPIWWLTCVR